MGYIADKIIEFNKSRELTLYPMGDQQLGAKNVDPRYFPAWIRKHAKKPGAMFLHTGDLTDDDRPTTRSRKRATYSDREDVLLEETDAALKKFDKDVIPMLLPLAESEFGIIGMLDGHHYRDLFFIEENVGLVRKTSTRYVCEQLSKITGREVPYLGVMTSWLALKFRHTNGGAAVEKMLHVQHGVGGGATIAAAVNKLEKTAHGHHGDVYIRAHDCTRVAAKKVIAEPTHSHGSAERKIRFRELNLLNIGALSQSPILSRESPDYAEMGVMNPKPRGWGRVMFNLTKDRRNGAGKGASSWHVDVDCIA